MIERIKNDRLLKSILRLAWPSVLEQLMMSAVTYVDTAMVGRIGAEASASVGLTSSVMWLIVSIFSALGVGTVACVSRASGAGEREKISHAAGQAIWLAIISGIIVGAVAVSLHSRVPVWMNGEANICPQAAEYFMIICIPMVFRALTAIMGSVLRGAGNTKTPMIINTSMNLVNIVLNFILIYQTRSAVIFGFDVIIPGLNMGTRGAALATAISVFIGGSAMLIAVCRNDTTRLKAQHMRLNGRIMREILIVGMPVLAQRVITCLAHVVFAALVAVLGTISIAAHSIAITAEEAFYISGYGIQNAAATLAGNSLGANDMEMFKKTARRCTVITVILLSFAGLILFSFAPQIMGIFTRDEAVLKMGASVLRIVALSEPIYGVLIVMEGMLNGIGDTKAPMVYAFITMWCIRIAISWVCINVFKLGLNAVWCCMVADNVTRTGLMVYRYLAGKWKKRFLQTSF